MPAKRDGREYDGVPIADNPDRTTKALRDAIRERADRMGSVRSLDSATWTVEANVGGRSYTRATAYHRDSRSRLVFTTDGLGIDTDLTLEVYVPLPSDGPMANNDPDDVDDMLVGKPMEFAMLDEAVWQAEFFARKVNRNEFGGLPEES